MEKLTLARINRRLPDKRYYTSTYAVDTWDLANKQYLSVVAIRYKDGKLGIHDYASQEAVPKWIYYGNYDYNAATAVTMWIRGEINRNEVCKRIQAGLVGEPYEDEEAYEH